VRIQSLWLLAAGLAVFLLGVGLAGGLPFARAESAIDGVTPVMAGTANNSVQAANQGDDNQGVLAVEAPVADTITYQGRLTNPGGGLLHGTHTMRFRLYDAAAAGTLLWDSGNLNVDVSHGLFSVDLNVDQADFNGQALWLRIDVNGETLTPRQALHPAPYALSLKPGADIIGGPPAASDAVLGVSLAGSWPAGKAVAGFAPATGTAVHAQASGGQGLFAHSNSTYGVRGSSGQGWGGYFSSDQGYGIVASTTGTDHWDHAGVFQAGAGYAIHATSSGNMAIRGEAGDTTGLWQPVGNVGLVGIGQSRGVYGSGGSSYGVYATSLNWYGVYGRTSRSDNNYGLYSPDNLYTRNINMAGALMSVAENGGETPLEPGDVVVFSGISQPLSTNGSPVIQVAAPTEANSPAVAGVVYSRFNIEVTADDDRDPDPDLEVTPAGAVQPGEFLLLVVQGPAQVRASASGGSIQPGDLLATGGNAGLAGRAEMMSVAGVETAVPGTVFAKALEPLGEGQDFIYVFVTLQ
jgi:hypothetical protein